MDATVESHLIGILLHPSVPKKSQAYNVNILYFHQLQFSRHKRSVATSIFNQYQRAGGGVLHFLGNIGLILTVQDAFPYIKHFPMTVCDISFCFEFFWIQASNKCNSMYILCLWLIEYWLLAVKWLNIKICFTVTTVKGVALCLKFTCSIR